MRISDWSSDVCSSDLGAEQHHEAAGAAAVQRRIERVPADAVIDDGNALAAGDLPHPRGDVLGPIEDGMVAAVPARERRLLLGSRSEELRVGKEFVITCRIRWSPVYKKNTKNKK